jgi:1-aminocyclopropane-1-carboxylate deaminase/D-cysteine desulfhydrase-like pyridoxal-dependent ACC family enzyme
MVELAAARVCLGQFPTPLHRSVELGDLSGVDELWIKRDDLTGFSWGGNKVRAVEYLLGDALAKGATEIIVSGGPSSNFTAIMAAAAQSRGLAIHQISYGDEPSSPVAALAAGRKSGALVTFTGSSDRSLMDSVGTSLALDRARDGVVVYRVPRGGATEVGALGFVTAAFELIDQLDRCGVEPGCIVIPLGSGGSTAGLVAGLAIAGKPWPVVAVSVSRAPEEIDQQIIETATRCAASIGITLAPQEFASRLTVHDARGAGFGQLDATDVRVAERVAAATGLLIDPTYNAKTLRWMVDAQLSSPVVYWHTGGALGAVDELNLVAEQ